MTGLHPQALTSLATRVTLAAAKAASVFAASLGSERVLLRNFNLPNHHHLG